MFFCLVIFYKFCCIICLHQFFFAGVSIHLLNLHLISGVIQHVWHSSNHMILQILVYFFFYDFQCLLRISISSKTLRHIR